jgi:hypothetical protein
MDNDEFFFFVLLIITFGIAYMIDGFIGLLISFFIVFCVCVLYKAYLLVFPYPDY